MALTALGRWDEVLAEMRVALETDPNAALAWLLKGEALVGKGDYLQAEQTLKRAKELDSVEQQGGPAARRDRDRRAPPASRGCRRSRPTPRSIRRAQTGNTDPELGNVVQPMPMDRGHLVQVPEDSEDVARRVRGRRDRGQSQSVGSGEHRRRQEAQDEAGRQAGVGARRLRRERGHRRGFAGRHRDVPQAGRAAHRRLELRRAGDDDYGERARPRVPVHAGPGGGEGVRGRLRHRRADRGLDDDAGRDPARAQADGERGAPSTICRSTAWSLPSRRSCSSTADLMIEPSREGFPRGFAPTFDSEDGEDEQTRQRRQRQVDEHAGTVPETPEPVLHRQRPTRAVRSVAARPRSSRSSRAIRRRRRRRCAARTARAAASTATATGTRTRTARGEDIAGRGARAGQAQEAAHDAVRARRRGAVARRSLAARHRAPVDRAGRGRRRRCGDGPSGARVAHARARGQAARAGASRSWRRETIPASRRRSCSIGRSSPSATIPRRGRSGRACWRRWRSSSATRPSRRSARWRRSATTPPARARTSGPAARTRPRRASTWRWPRASSIAPRGWRRRCGASSPTRRRRYLVGRAELLLERPDSAGRRAAHRRRWRRAQSAGAARARPRRGGGATRRSRARGLSARAGGQRQPHRDHHRPRAACRSIAAAIARRRAARSKASSASWSATRRRGSWRARSSASPSSSCRRATSTAARRDLAQAAAKRRDGDALLSEELAQAFADAYMLDEAEREAKRAIAAAGRLTPRLVLAEVALRRAQPQKALAVIEEAGTSRPEALVMRALASLMLGRKESARLDAEAALRVQPGDWRRRQGGAGARRHRRRASGQGAAARWPRSSARRRRRADVAAALAAVFLAQKVPDRARWWLQQALAARPARRRGAAAAGQARSRRRPVRRPRARI